MTTIAYDAKLRMIAADSQEMGDNGHKFNCKKLFRVEHLIIATAGGSYSGMAFVNWIKEWVDAAPDWDDHPDFTNLGSEEDFECLVINTKTGSCYSVNRLFIPIDQAGNQFLGLGSGAQAACGAMMAGKDPRAAVEIAKRIDIYTGGKVHSISF